MSNVIQKVIIEIIEVINAIIILRARLDLRRIKVTTVL